MRRKTTKLLSCTMAVFIAAGLLAGCGGNKMDVKNSSTNEVKEERYKITWTASQAAPLGDNPRILEMIEKKYNVDIEIWNLDAKKFDELLNLRIASGEVPDLVRINTNVLLNQYVMQDALTQIDKETVKKQMPNLYKEYTEQLDPQFFDKYGIVDGKLYAIPTIKERAKYRVPLVYRGDWMKNVGIEKVPDTLEEFEKLMYAFANNDPDKNGKKDTYGFGKSMFQAIYGAFGVVFSDTWPSLEYPTVQWQKRDGKLVFTSVQPEVKEALKLLNKWYKDGIIDPEFITGEDFNQKAGTAFITNRIGTSANGLWVAFAPQLEGRTEVGQIYSELKKANPVAADNLVFGTPPQGPKGHRGMRHEALVTESQFGYGIQLKNQPGKLAKIMSILDDVCFASIDNAASAWFGEKGKDWQMNKYGIPESTQEKWDVQAAAREGGHTQVVVYKSLNLWKFPDSLTQWVEKTSLNKYGVKEELTNSLPSLSKYQTELNNLQTDSFIKIISGEKPVDYFDEFVKKWRSAGGDQLEKEANRK